MTIIISRAIQGASTTFTWVTGLSFLVAQVGECDLGEYVGWTTVGVAVGEVVGPFVGGPIYDYLGHWATFGIVEALLFVDILFRLLAKEKKPRVDTEIRAEQGTEARTEQDSESDRLLQGGQAVSTNYNTTHGDTKGTDSPASVVSSLAWNWLGTVFALVVIFTVRGSLEVVSRSTRVLFDTQLTSEGTSFIFHTAVFMDADQDQLGLVNLASAGSIKSPLHLLRYCLRVSFRVHSSWSQVKLCFYVSLSLSPS